MSQHVPQTLDRMWLIYWFFFFTGDLVQPKNRNQFVKVWLWSSFANWQPVISGLFATILAVPAGKTIFWHLHKAISIFQYGQKSLHNNGRLYGPCLNFHIWMMQRSGCTISQSADVDTIRSKVNITLLATRTDRHRRVSYQRQGEAWAAWSGRWDCVEWSGFPAEFCPWSTAPPPRPV